MAAIDGISSLSNSTSAGSYQAKPTTEVKSVDAVSSSSSNMDSAVAAQVVTVKQKENSDSGQSGKDKQDGSTASNEQIKKAVEALNKKMTGTVCEYGYHDETNRVTIKIVNKDTKEVIKEYPAEETLDMIAKVWELAGLMVDKKL